MVFGQKMIEAILDGRKTVTRRPVKFEKPAGPRHQGGIATAPVPVSCGYAAGHTYSIQPVIEDGPGKGRGGKSVGRIKVLDVRRELLSGVAVGSEYKHEGFGDYDEFFRYWEDLYGEVDLSQPVWRIAFELVEVKGR